MTDVREDIAAELAALQAKHLPNGDGICETCGEEDPCNAAGLLGMAGDRIALRLTRARGTAGEGASMVTEFIRSSFCDNSSGNCVEVGKQPGARAVRDSKDPNGPVLVYTEPEWQDFISGVKAGQFD